MGETMDLRCQDPGIPGSEILGFRVWRWSGGGVDRYSDRVLLVCYVFSLCMYVYPLPLCTRVYYTLCMHHVEYVCYLWSG